MVVGSILWLAVYGCGKHGNANEGTKGVIEKEETDREADP